MQINAVSSLLQILLANEAKRATAAPVPSFEPPVPTAVAPATVGSPTQSVQMLVTLAAAMVPPEQERRRRVTKEAEKVLDALQMLQAALVVGVGATEPIKELRSWSEERTLPEDAELAALMDDLDLRVQVELAKLERE
ncbi:flagellar assembly protein FliX [Novosphingobium rhizovicinum]|uniref:Flagellar assembly protein FliX n=1 Tax=Novosphingobium rhizovicinum TaxID=3228928 RepID=A0ABV3R8V2_9SPHN